MYATFVAGQSEELAEEAALPGVDLDDFHAVPPELPGFLAMAAVYVLDCLSLS